MKPLLTAAIFHTVAGEVPVEDLIEGVLPYVSDLILFDCSGGEPLACSQDNRVRYFRSPFRGSSSAVKNECLGLVVTPYVLFLDSADTICGAANWRGLYSGLEALKPNAAYCVPVRRVGTSVLEWSPALFHSNSVFEGEIAEFSPDVEELSRFVLPLLRKNPPLMTSNFSTRLSENSLTSVHALTEYAMACEFNGSRQEAYGAYAKALKIDDLYAKQRKHLLLSGLLRTSLGSPLVDLALLQVLDNEELINLSPTINYLLGLVYAEKSKGDLDADQRSLATGFFKRAESIGDTPWLDGHMVGSGSKLPAEQIKFAHALS